jgi:uncharacterized RDD family membrane protein YckC
MDKYQTIFLRFVALIIDYLLLIPIMYSSLQLKPYLFENGFSADLSTFVVTKLSLILYTLYYVLMHGFFGQTLGKMVVGVKVVDTADVKINIGQSLIRSLPQIILIIITLGFNSRYLMSGETNQKESQIAAAVESLLSIAVLLWTVLNIIVTLSSNKHEALHDLFAGTVVVKTKV